LLTEYRSSFDDLTPNRLVRYLRSRVSAVLTESMPVIGAVTGDAADSDARSRLLERRAETSIETLARRVRTRIDEGMTAAEAFVDVQPHALHAARATVETWVHQSMFLMVERVDDPALKDLLSKVAALADLWHIQADIGWYLQHGVLTSSGASELRDAVIALSEQLAEHARTLVDGFGIPDEVLAAPIAT
jgi:acyl-CoA oxidase